MVLICSRVCGDTIKKKKKSRACGDLFLLLYNNIGIIVLPFDLPALNHLYLSESPNFLAHTVINKLIFFISMYDMQIHRDWTI